jgi:hypothetical protein
MTDATRRTVGRRTVVRGAVATAWAVPVVQAVAAAPALAATSGPPNLSSTTLKNSNTNNADVNLTANVVNTGGSATTTLTALVSWKATDKSKIVSVSMPNGWTQVGGSSGRSWTTTTLLNPSKPLSVSVTVTTNTKKPTGTLSVQFTPGTGTGGSVSATFA